MAARPRGPGPWALGIGLGSRVTSCAPSSPVPHGQRYLFLRLVGLPGGSHGYQSPPPPRPGPRRKPHGLRPPSGAAAAILGSVPRAVRKLAAVPSFVPRDRPHCFPNPATDCHEWNARGGDLEKRDRLPSRSQGGRSTEHKEHGDARSPQPLLRPNRHFQLSCASPGPAEEGAGRAPRAGAEPGPRVPRCFVLREGGSPPALPEVACRCFRGPLRPLPTCPLSWLW